MAKRRKTKLDLELDKAIQAFNRRVSYSNKTNPKVITPDKVKRPAEKLTSKQKRSMINQLESYSNRKIYTNKYGVKINEYVLKQAQKELKKVNAARKKEYDRIKNLEQKAGGVKTGKTLSEAGNQRTDMLRPITFNPENYKDRKVLAERLKNIEKQSSPTYLKETDELWIENYLKAATKEFGGEFSDKLKDLFEKIGYDKVIDELYSNSDTEIDFIYEGKYMYTENADSENEFKEYDAATYILDIWQDLSDNPDNHVQKQNKLVRKSEVAVRKNKKR